MSPRSKRRRAKVGTVRVHLSNNSLQAVFTTEGKRHFVSLGLSNTPINRKKAEEIAFQIQRDIEYGEFDPTYTRYNQTKLVEPEPEPEAPPPLPTICELWRSYRAVRQVGKSPATVRMYGWVEKHLERCQHKQLDEAQAIFDWLCMNVPPDSARRVLTQLSACCKWAVQRQMLEVNPFVGMAARIKLKKAGSSEDEIFPFTREERDRIIKEFSTNRYYKPYAPLVEFLFLTGCRPSEAIALRWQNVKPDYILFEEAVVYDGVRPVVKQGLKTQQYRKFPMNGQLRSLLQRLRGDRNLATDHVFPSPKGKILNWNNFTKRGWQRVLQGLQIEYRNPYQTKHTFCSLCREEGIASIHIAKWVGSSPEMIDRVYAKPIDDIQVPEW